MNRALRERLIEAASTEDEFVHYREVADILDLPDDLRLDQATEMYEALDEISTFEHEHGRPLLTAVVVHVVDHMPGKGFFKMAKRTGKQKPGQDDDKFFFDELHDLREYWRSQARAKGPGN